MITFIMIICTAPFFVGDDQPKNEIIFSKDDCDLKIEEFSGVSVYKVLCDKIGIDTVVPINQCSMTVMKRNIK